MAVKIELNSIDFKYHIDMHTR